MTTDTTTEVLTLEVFLEAVEAVKDEPIKPRFYPAWMLPFMEKE